jgi:hypothetical protein
MNRNYWNRLARAGRLAPPEPPPEMPYGFETRVVSAWRSRLSEGNSGVGVWLLRGALVCSAVIMLVSLVLNLGTLRHRETAGIDPEPAGTAIANSALQITMVP